jgi:hypothetical protein
MRRLRTSCHHGMRRKRNRETEKPKDVMRIPERKREFENKHDLESRVRLVSRQDILCGGATNLCQLLSHDGGKIGESLPL